MEPTAQYLVLGSNLMSEIHSVAPGVGSYQFEVATVITGNDPAPAAALRWGCAVAGSRVRGVA